MLRPKQRTAQTITVTAPVGGWNAVSSLASMNPSEAVVCDNWFCLPTELMIRQGYTEWVTGMTGTVKSFLAYDSQTGYHDFFAVAGSGLSYSIYDVSAEGAVGTAVVTGLTGGDFKYQLTSNGSSSFCMAVNGVDHALLYDGTTWHSLTQTSTPYKIQGVDSDKLCNVRLHKHRMWFIEKNSMLCWYLDTDAVSGTAHSYDFGPLFAHGGKIANIETWTLDAGWGMDDYFVVITTSGEIAVFSGTDPADPTNWQLQGVYYVGSPVGTNNTIKYGGDVLLLNKDGLIPLSQCLMSSRVSIKTSITNKIQQRITDATTAYENNYGWQVVLFPPANMLFINVPTSSTTSEQYVMNTITGSWSRFTNINAVCWIFINELIYFGMNGNVYKFWDGHSDNGAMINTDLLPAFNSFGNQAQQKRFNMCRISMGYDVSFAFNARINLNFDQSTLPGTPYASPTTQVGLWDTASWDGAIFGGSIMPYSEWKQAQGMGYYASYRITTSSNKSDIRYYATDYLLEAGGTI